MMRTIGAGPGRNNDPDGGRSSVPARVARGFVGGRAAIWIALGLAVQGFLVPLAIAQHDSRTPEKSRISVPGLFHVSDHKTADRDSLMDEIKTYSQMIRGLRDSLSSDGFDLQLSAAQREKLEGNISDISQVIERISNELSRMEFEIKDNRISLVNESGEGIVINVPEDLDEQVSQGIEAITKIILSELPDSVDFDNSQIWDWKQFRPEPPAPERRVINGNVVKVWDDVHISAKEDVRGNVVVVFGNADVAGRVDGTVVSVFGNMSLDDSAEVTGSVVAVGGYLDQAPGAIVDDVVVLDPLQLDRRSGWFGFLSHDLFSFLVCQGVFLLTIMMAMIAVTITPAHRFAAITAHLHRRVGYSLGLGVVAALVGHMLVGVLMAILVLTVIGVPLALLVGLALLVVVVISVAVCGAVVGDRLCAMFGDRCHSRWLVVLVGMTALHAVSFLGSLLGVVGGSLEALSTVLVALGFIIKTLAYLLGLGALVTSRFGVRQAAQ